MNGRPCPARLPASPAFRGSGSATRRRRWSPPRIWARRSASSSGSSATTAPGLPWAATRCASWSSTSARPAPGARTRCWRRARCSRTWCGSRRRPRAGSAWRRISSLRTGWAARARSTANRATCCSTGCWGRRSIPSPRARTRRRRTRRWKSARRRWRPRGAGPTSSPRRRGMRRSAGWATCWRPGRSRRRRVSWRSASTRR